jgi:hypothetical protein
LRLDGEDPRRIARFARLFDRLGQRLGHVLDRFNLSLLDTGEEGHELL